MNQLQKKRQISEIQRYLGDGPDVRDTVSMTKHNDILYRLYLHLIIRCRCNISLQNEKKTKDTEC